jgi:iron complex transport system substrate-binding protein
MKHKNSILLLSVIPTAIVLSGCNYPLASSAPLTIVDDTGESFSITTNPSHIICLSKAATSFLHYLKKDKEIIAVHKNITLDAWDKLLVPDLTSLPTYGKKPTVEAVIASGADFVIMMDSEQTKVLRKAGIFTFCFNPVTEEALFADIKALGMIFGTDSSKKLDEWLTNYKDENSSCQKATASLQDRQKPSVYYIDGVLSSNSLYTTYGANSVINSLIKTAGGSLVTESIAQDSIQEANHEEIVKSNPSTILIGGFFDYTLKNQLLSDPVWANVDAVKNNRVYLAPEGFGPWVQFGTEYGLMTKWTTNLLHPELLTYDATSTIQSFYKNYFNFELTPKQNEYILASLLPDGTTPNA